MNLISHFSALFQKWQISLVPFSSAPGGEKDMRPASFVGNLILYNFWLKQFSVAVEEDLQSCQSVRALTAVLKIRWEAIHQISMGEWRMKQVCLVWVSLQSPKKDKYVNFRLRIWVKGALRVAK